MNAISAVFSEFGTRPATGARNLPGAVSLPPLETKGVAAGGATSYEEMILEMEEKSFHAEVALRIQVGDMGKQPLSRVEKTDLALMIMMGTAMTQALAAAAADSAPISTLPGAYSRAY